MAFSQGREFPCRVALSRFMSQQANQNCFGQPFQTRGRVIVRGLTGDGLGRVLLGHVVLHQTTCEKRVQTVGSRERV